MSQLIIILPFFTLTFLHPPLSKLTRALLVSANLVESQKFSRLDITSHSDQVVVAEAGGGGVIRLRTLHPHKKGEFFKKAN